MALLLSSGAVLVARAVSFDAALHFAIESDDRRASRMLVAASCGLGFGLDLADVSGRTALSMALAQRDGELVLQLLDAGASPTDRGAVWVFGKDGGPTPILTALEHSAG